MTTNEKGAQTEGAVLAALLKSGYTVLMPFGVVRYDLVIEISPGEFKRVQCKTARRRRDNAGVIQFNVDSRPPGGVRRTYTGDADFFGVYFPELDRVYLIPVDDLADYRTEASLRIEPAANGQQKKTRLAAQYQISGQ